MLVAGKLWMVGRSACPVFAENVSDPVFSRDGRKLAYAQFYIDTNIWRLDVPTADAPEFIASTQFDSSPHCSPDGPGCVSSSRVRDTTRYGSPDA